MAARSVVTELGIFGIGMGLMLGGAAYLTFTQLSPGAPELWGMQRHLAIGLPVSALAVGNLASGVMLLITRKRGFIGACTLAGCAITVFYFFFMVSATGSVGINVLTIVMLVLPLVMLSRASAASKELEEETATEAKTHLQ